MFDDTDLKFGMDEEPRHLNIAPPPEPEINYFLALLEGLHHQYAHLGRVCQAQKKYEEAMYYKGKADACLDSIQHYLRLTDPRQAKQHRNGI